MDRKQKPHPFSIVTTLTVSVNILSPASFMVRAGIGIGKMSWEKLTLRHVQNTNTHPATIPVFLYGTAWKKDRTADLVHQAINSGFRAVDTAAQPKHYQEDAVGEGIRRAIKDGTVRREDLHVCPARL